MRSKLVAALAAGALVLAACGGDDDDDAAEAPSTEAASEETSAASEPAASESPAESTINGSDCLLEEPLKIGYVGDVGVGGIADVPGIAAAGFMVETINAAGGVGGQPVEYEVKQIANDDAAAAQRATRELLDGGTDIIIGPPFSNLGLPMLEETKGETPILFMSSTEVVLADASQGSFLVSFNDKVQASAMAEFALGKGFTNAVTLSSADIPYLTINPEAFTSVFEQGGGTVSKDLSFSLGATDFSQQVNEIAAMDPQPDAIFSAFFLPEAGIFIEQLREAGVESTILSADGFDASVAWSVGEVTEGASFSTHTFPSAANNVQQFLDDYAASGGEPIETIAFGALAADTVQIAAAATTSACSLDGPTLISAIGAIENLPVTTGVISYAGTTGTPRRDVVILTIEGGVPVLADAFFPAVVAD